MKPRLPFLLLLQLALLLAGPAQAGIVRGVVTHVADGDSIRVRTGGGAALQVRILDIDAPETCQAYGQQAKKALAARLLRQNVVLTTRGHDDYGRLLAKVRHRNQDVGAWLVRKGAAWSGRYRGKRGPYGALEDEARRARRGLWAAARPEEPRAFRQRHGSCA